MTSMTMDQQTHGALRTVRDHCLAPGREAVDAPSQGARYGRMFPDLAPLQADPEALLRAGAPGGVCDASVFPSRTGHASDDSAEAAGWPFFGQFIAHDITADRSPIGLVADEAALRNARSPRLNLEMLHDEGPIGSPFLYDTRDPAKLMTSEDGLDLPRNWQGTALIGDPRNDVHRLVAALHLAFIHAHNGLVDRLREDGVAETDLYDEARRALVWHYQWVVVNDFLPRLVGAELADRLVAGDVQFFSPAHGEAFIPLEFADAAYRYGHGQIRHRYQLQPGGPQYPLFPDLFGHGATPPEHRVDLSMLFDLPGGPPAQRAKRLDGGLPTSLIALPTQITGEVATEELRSLAVRDLMRGHATHLPSGEAVARHLGVEPLSADDLGIEGWSGDTPLWLYVLKEAQHGGGDQLGPVGGRIVGEVLLGLLRADGESYLSVDPAWEPTLPRAGAKFELADLLAFADTVANSVGSSTDS
jgi:hypothetical protein